MTIIAQIPERISKLWNEWEIQGMVLVSLLLQIILIIFGSRRKYSPRIYLLVWPAYLLADMVATVALGILSRSLGDLVDSCTKPNYQLQAFWAPFLLLHLGGPDTITAYAVEDNELWLRHLFGLAGQVVVAFYIFFKAWDINVLSFIAIPMFVAGIIKYGERTWVLYSSSTHRIKDSLLAAPPRLRLDTKEIMVVPRGHYVPKANYIHQAYYLFKMSKYLFEDFVLSFTELKDSHSIISSQSSTDAFNLVAVELGFMYDFLYTKANRVYTPLGIFLRSVSFFSSTTALVVFFIIVDKHAYSVVDLATTYLLLVGAVVLELYALFYLIFSDRAMMWLTKFESPPANPVGGAIYSIHTKFNRMRWSESIAQYNLISSGRKMKTHKFFQKLGIDEMIKRMHIRWERINDDMKELIFMQLLERSNEIMEHLHDTDLRNKLVDRRGDGVLQKMQHLEKDGVLQEMEHLDKDGVLQKMEHLDKFRWSTTAIDFTHSLLIWHIATDLCYCSCSSDDVKNPRSQPRLSKCLSDYMFYLLVVRPHMLPKGIGDAGSRYRGACEEVKRFFKKKNSDGHARSRPNDMDTCKTLGDMEHAVLEDIIAAPIDTTPTIPGAYGSSKYMLVLGCMLAKQLKSLKLGEQEQWKMISDVWIEMLAYAAIRCDWKEHAQQLRRGGELLTHVCMLMSHLGLSQQYQEILVY